MLGLAARDQDGQLGQLDRVKFTSLLDPRLHLMGPSVGARTGTHRSVVTPSSLLGIPNRNWVGQNL